MEYIFLAGIHGVGKTTLLNRVKESTEIETLAISDLIRSAGNNINISEKRTNDIVNNQQLWVQELYKQNFPQGIKVILDGHLSLLDTNSEIKRLEFSVFEGIEISKVVLKKENPNLIQERLYTRDQYSWDLKLINEFQKVEEQQVTNFCLIRNIPFLIYENDNMFPDLLHFIEQ